MKEYHKSRKMQRGDFCLLFLVLHAMIETVFIK